MLWHSEVIADFVKTIFLLVQESGYFLLKQLVYLNIDFCFVWKCWVFAFLILILSTQKRYSRFLKKGVVFQKFCFKVKVQKSFKISSDSDNFTNGGRFGKSLVLFFRKIFALSFKFKMKPLRKIVFLYLDKFQLKFCHKTCW